MYYIVIIFFYVWYLVEKQIMPERNQQTEWWSWNYEMLSFNVIYVFDNFRGETPNWHLTLPYFNMSELPLNKIIECSPKPYTAFEDKELMTGAGLGMIHYLDWVLFDDSRLSMLIRQLLTWFWSTLSLWALNIAVKLFYSPRLQTNSAQIKPWVFWLKSKIHTNQATMWTLLDALNLIRKSFLLFLVNMDHVPKSRMYSAVSNHLLLTCYLYLLNLSNCIISIYPQTDH